MRILDRLDKYVFAIWLALLLLVLLYDLNFSFDVLPAKDGYALVIAVIALVVSLWQAYVARIHNFLSVVPALSASTANTSDTGLYQIKISNKGLGPARIIECQYYWNKEPVNLTIIKSKIDNYTNNEWTVGFTESGNKDLIAKDECLTVLEIDFGLNSYNSNFSNLTDEERRDIMIPVAAYVGQNFGMDVSYESLYGNKKLNLRLGVTAT